MARGDSLLFEISKRALISSLTDTRAITYRQEVLADCLSHPEMFREMYALAMEAITAERKIWQPFGDTPPTFSIGPFRYSSCSWCC